MGLSFGALGFVLRSSSESAAPASLHVAAAPRIYTASVVEHALNLVELRSLLIVTVVVLVSFILGELSLRRVVLAFFFCCPYVLPSIAVVL